METVPLDSMPVVAQGLSESLRDFKMDHLLPRLSFEVVKDVTINSPIDLACLEISFLSIRMWDFCSFTVRGEEGVFPLEPGDYQVNVEQLEEMGDGSFPIRFRQLRVCLDGSPDKWRAIMDTCVN